MHEANALSALARSGALLSDNTFAGTLAMAPSLTLQAIPQACRVVVTVTHPVEDEPVRTAASRPTPGASSVPLATRSLSVDIALTPQGLAGSVVLTTEEIGGFGATEQLAVRVMVTQIEAALRCAYAVERARSMTLALERGEDIGVAVGLVMASQSVDRVQAYVLLEHLSRADGRTVVDLSREVITAGTVPAQRVSPLRLVASNPNE